ncbi:hypothetical protein EPO15_09275 [bacterium]|nr:MAG: hypothetical protein EPO15_09275 [bacterium]
MAKPRVGPAFRAALERGRKRYNAALAEAAASGAFDSGAFLESFAAAAGPAAEAAPEALDTLFALALEQARRSGGAFLPPAGWSGLLRTLAPRLSEDPARLAPSLYNALHNLERFPGARAADWAERLGRAAVACPDSAALLAAGRALSWMCGMAHYREGGLAALAALPPAAAASALGVPAARVPAALKALEADPWAALDGSEGGVLKVVHRVGGFRGFGGPFLAPPVLAYSEGVVYARSGDGVWRLHADRFGAALTRCDSGPWKAQRPAGGYELSADGRVGQAGRWSRIAELAGASSWTSDGGCLAATLPLSHFVLVVAVQ